MLRRSPVSWKTGILDRGACRGGWVRGGERREENMKRRTGRPGKPRPFGKPPLFGKRLAMAAFGCAALAAVMPASAADLTYERLLNPEPQNWLMNHHDYTSQRLLCARCHQQGKRQESAPGVRHRAGGHLDQ
jgi:hypothetical protein